MRPVRLALLAASPVYYQAPLYRRLAADPRLDFTAIFASSSGVRPGDLGYGRPVAFDADALGGFTSVFLRRSDRTEVESERLVRELHDWDVVPTVLRGDCEVLWLHGYSSPTHVLAASLQRLRRRPLLLREEQTLLHPRSAWRRALKRVVFSTALCGAYGLAIGTESRRWQLARGIPAERIFHVPYAVDNEVLRASATALRPHREALRRSFGITPEAGPVIVSVARLVAKKQPLHLLDAFARAREHRRCALLLVGSGPLEEELRREVAQRRIPDVHLSGFLNQSQVVRAYAAADAFALVSKEHETWGVAVNEALNFSLPVVVSDKVGAATDLVREDVNGFVVPAYDVAALAERLARLVDSPFLRARLGAASPGIADAFTYEVAAHGVVEAVAASVGAARWSEAQPEPARAAA